MESAQYLNSLAQISQPQTLRNTVSTVLKKFQQREKNSHILPWTLGHFTYIEALLFVKLFICDIWITTMGENRKFESRTNSLYYHQSLEVKGYLVFKYNIIFS